MFSGFRVIGCSSFIMQANERDCDCRSNGDRGKKKKKGSMSSVESKPDRKLKKKREKENEETFSRQIQWIKRNTMRC